MGREEAYLILVRHVVNERTVDEEVVETIACNAFCAKIIVPLVEENVILDPTEVLVIIRVFFNDVQEVLSLDHKQRSEVDAADADAPRRACEEAGLAEAGSPGEDFKRSDFNFPRRLVGVNEEFHFALLHEEYSYFLRVAFVEEHFLRRATQLLNQRDCLRDRVL